MHKVNIGIDVGGTKIHAALYDSAFDVVKEKRIATRAQEGIEVVLSDVADLIREMMEPGVSAVGVGLPGDIDKNDVLWATPNIKFSNTIDLRKFFREFRDLKMGFANDASLFTLAEYDRNPDNQGMQTFIGITLGTGLGGGVIIDGEIHKGENGFATDFGHMPFDINQDYEDILASKGNDDARGKYLGVFISSMIRAYNPGAIAIGGAISKHFDEFNGEMWTEIKARTPKHYYENLRIYRSELENPGTLGAAVLAAKIS